MLCLMSQADLSDSKGSTYGKRQQQQQQHLTYCDTEHATPEMDDNVPCLRITEKQVKRIEHEIDALNENLSDLSSFILPGGSSLSSWLHFARTVARRAEREIAALSAEEPINKFAMHFINRLSDHLFVLARVANQNGKNDVLWVPGAQTGKQK